MVAKVLLFGGDFAGQGIMASKKGCAGSSTRKLADRRAAIRATIGIAVAAVLVLFFTILPHAQAVGLGAVLVLALAVKMLIGFLDSKVDAKIAEEKRALRGAVAEEKVEDILDRLGIDHLVIHDVRCQFGNIDHVVLSKEGGVFLIETKAHGGRVAVVESKIRINGKLPEKDFIAQTLRSTYWLIEELETITGVRPWVTSVIVFTNAFVARSAPVKGITITNAKFLRQEMKRLGQPLPAKVWAGRDRIASLLAATHQV